MEIVLVKMLLIGSVSAQFGKHVYVEQWLKWPEAQEYCRDHYTDLSPITTRTQEERLKKATAGKVTGEFWIGLYKDGAVWKWSGGGNATNNLWDLGHPKTYSHHVFAAGCSQNCRWWRGWHSRSRNRQNRFFCINLIVTESKMSWEHALKYCRQNHNTLTSLDSETEHLLALRQIQQDNITERVWVGLRYLADSWLWVDGSPLEYQVWPQGGDQDNQCPKQNRCGALSKGGQWQSWDCEDRLNFICH